MFEQAVHFWKKCLDIGRIDLNANHHIQDHYDQEVPSNTNVMLEPPELLLAECVPGMDRPADGSERRKFVRPERNPILAITHPLSKFWPPEGTVFYFCMKTGSTSKAWFLTHKHLKVFERKAHDCCVSKSMHSICKSIVNQILNDDADII